jgi:hypothetical protein
LKKSSEKMQKIVNETKVEVGEVKREGIDRKEVEKVRKDLDELMKEGVEVKKSYAQILNKEDTRIKEGGTSFAGDRRKMQMEITELMEREKRRGKLVMMGIPEGDAGGDGEDIIRDVIQGLMQEVKVEFTVIGRIGRKGEKARPVRIGVDDMGHRRRLLARARMLRGINGFEAIYIVPDLTRIQQLEDKKIREEIKARRLAGEAGGRVEGGVVVGGKEVEVEVVEDAGLVGGSGGGGGGGGGEGN